MKEIDFLPEWYKTGARKLSNYRTLYVAVMCVFVVVVVSSFVTARSVSTARAQIDQMQTVCAAASPASQEYAELKSQFDTLVSQANILERLDSKIIVSNILGELSFLIDKGIVLNKVCLEAEPFDDTVARRAGGSRGVRAARTWRGQGSVLQGDVRFKVGISGIAADGADVARLVRKLEESVYFRQVIPGVSHNKKITGQGGSEFEISCYVANYIEPKPGIN